MTEMNSSQSSDGTIPSRTIVQKVKTGGVRAVSQEGYIIRMTPVAVLI